MKKIIVLLVCVLFLCTGCTNTASKPVEEGMKDGTFYGVGDGRNGAITVAVTTEGGALKAIKVLSSNETKNTGSVPVELYPELMVQGQTVNVDNVTGATISSMAVKNAVKEAITNAGGNVDAFSAKYSIEMTAEDCETDIVVIGAGGAGMTAAISAAQKGASVILLEKLGIVGGTSNYSVEALGSVGDKTHVGLGSDIDAETLAGNLTKSNPKGTAEAFEVLANNNGKMADWLRSIGAPLTVSGGQTSVASSREVGYLGNTIVTALTKECEKVGVDTRINSKATEIISENGVIKGVKVSNSAGEYTISCKAVVIATGGFGANNDMVAEGYPSLKGYNSSCSVGNTGDGQLMAKELGAELKDMDYIRVNFTYTTNPENSYYYYMGSLFNTGAIFVNNDGVRFVNDQGAYGVGLKVVAEADGQGWAIFDSSIVEGVADVSMYESLGLFQKADTIEELAEMIGVPADNLANTIKTYQGYVANGKDEEFGRAMLNMTFDEAPFYACKMNARVQGTFGGIATNVNAEVLTTQGDVISGLYAAGECASEGTYGANPAAVNLVFGNIAGQNAANFVK